MTLEDLIKLKSKVSITSYIAGINTGDELLEEIANEEYATYLAARKQFIKDNPNDEMCNFITKTSFDNNLEQSLNAIGKKTMNMLMDARNNKEEFFKNPISQGMINKNLESLISGIKVGMDGKGKDSREVLYLNDPNIGDRDTVFAIVERMANICKDFKQMKFINDYQPPKRISKVEQQIDLLNMFNVPYTQSYNNGSFMTDISPDTAMLHIRNDDDTAGSVAHELGHVLYQREILNVTNIGKIGGCPSLSLHESSSIFFELALGGFNNTVSNGYHNVKRLTSDKVNYILHIYVRMIIEDEIFTGKITPEQIPQRWNELVKEHIGIEVKDDFDGYLQDVHWFDGAFGYFHSYAIGMFNAVNMLMDVEDKFNGDNKHDIEQVILPKIEEMYGWVSVSTDDILEKIHPNMEESFKKFEKFIHTRMTWN